MKIGVDMDEVVASFIPKFIEFYNLQNRSDIKFEDWTSYNFWEVIGGTREEAIKLVDDFWNSKMFDEIDLVEGAKESLEKLSERNKLIIVTSRPLRFAEKTERFFQKHFPKINFDLFYSDDFHKQHSIGKAGICVREGIEVFVEDNLDYAIACYNEGIKVFLLDKPWNQGNCNGVLRVGGWYGVLNKIKEIENESLCD